MNINNKLYVDIWIGLAKVQSDKKLTGISNAYVNVVGVARNKIDFRIKVKQELFLMNFKLLRLEESEPFDQRIANHRIDKSLHQLADEVLNSESKIRFSTFHAWTV